MLPYILPRNIYKRERARDRKRIKYLDKINFIKFLGNIVCENI